MTASMGQHEDVATLAEFGPEVFQVTRSPVMTMIPKDRGEGPLPLRPVDITSKC